MSFVEPVFLVPGGQYFTYSELKTKPAQLNRAHLESYLTPEEFQAVFGVTRDQFFKQPAWKQIKVKQEKDLF